MAEFSPALTGSGPLSISPASAVFRLMPRRLMVRLRTLNPSIEVRILAGHPTRDLLHCGDRFPVEPAALRAEWL